jgi:hypothetical protein
MGLCRRRCDRDRVFVDRFGPANGAVRVRHRELANVPVPTGGSGLRAVNTVPRAIVAGELPGTRLCVWMARTILCPGCVRAARMRVPRSIPVHGGHMDGGVRVTPDEERGDDEGARQQGGEPEPAIAGPRCGERGGTRFRPVERQKPADREQFEDNGDAVLEPDGLGVGALDEEPRPTVREVSHRPIALAIRAIPPASTERPGRPQSSSPPRPACRTATTSKPTIMSGSSSCSAAAETWIRPAAIEQIAVARPIVRSGPALCS